MSSYPNSIYSPRIKENKSGVVYDPLKKQVVFAEDIVYDDDEIVAIEETLGLNPQGGFDDVVQRLIDVDARFVPYTGADDDVDLNSKSISNVHDFSIAGLFTNTLATDDATGIYIDGNTNPFTGVDSNYGIRLERVIAGASSISSFATNGIYTSIVNTYAKNGPDFVTGDMMQNIGYYISVVVSGVHTGAIPGFSETNMGLTVYVGRGGPQCTIDTSGGPPSPAVFTNIGVDAWGNSQTTFNNANSDFQNDVYGLRIYATNLPTNTASNSLIVNNYGAYIYARGNTAGISTNYGLYLDDCSGADTNWGIYVNSSANSFFGNDNAKSYFGTGQDASIYYNGVNMVVKPNNVGTGVLVIDGATNYGADAGGTDTYVITVTGITAYTTGMMIIFKANTVNTGAASLNVNGLGAITIVKAVSTTLANNDILASMFCIVVYNGTNFVLMNPRVL